MEERRNLKRIRITSPVIIEGKGHAAVGEVHSLPRHKALDIIASGCAVEHLERAEDKQPARTAEPVNADPKPQHGDPAFDKRGPKQKSAS